MVCWLTHVVYTVSRVNKPLGLSFYPYVNGRLLTWYVTVVCSTADSYIDLAIQGPGSVSEMAASRKEAKYAALQTRYHIFQPISVETLGPINESARAFLDDLGRRISVLSGDDKRAFVFISTHFCCHSAF